MTIWKSLWKCRCSVTERISRQHWKLAVIGVVLAFGCTRATPPPPATTSAPQAGTEVNPEGQDSLLTVQVEPVGETPSGEPIKQYMLTNRNGTQVTIIDYGATVTAISAPSSFARLPFVRGLAAALSAPIKP